jgi:hypothetical protein
MNADEAIRLVGQLKPEPRTIIPLHYDGWTHFREPLEHARQRLDSSPLAARLRWLLPGTPTDIEV